MYMIKMFIMSPLYMISLVHIYAMNLKLEAAHHTFAVRERRRGGGGGGGERGRERERGERGEKKYSTGVQVKLIGYT